jgi:hypothetical protein
VIGSKEFTKSGRFALTFRVMPKSLYRKSKVSRARKCAITMKPRLRDTCALQ